MARMRSIKPEFWADQDLTRLRRDLRLLYVALWNFADEHGRMQGDPRLVKSWCFPLDDDLTANKIDGWLNELVEAGKLVRYELGGSQYMHLPTLSRHQKLDPRLDSRLPAPPDPDQSVINTDQSVRTGVENEDQHPAEVAKHVAGAGGREHVASSKGQGSARGTRIPDDWTPDEALVETMRREGIHDDLSRRELLKFRDYWASAAGAKGVRADWSATWRNWLRRAVEDGRGGPAPNGAGKATQKAAGWLTVGTEQPLRALPGGSS